MGCIDRYNLLMLVWLKQDPKSFWDQSSYVQLWKDRDPEYIKKMGDWITKDSDSASIVFLLNALKIPDPIAQNRGQTKYMFSKNHLDKYIEISKLKKKIKILSNKDSTLKEKEMVKLFHQYIIK